MNIFGAVINPNKTASDAFTNALKEPAVQEAGRTFAIDMFSRITSQDALYTKKVSDINIISKNLTDSDIQGFDFTNQESVEEALKNFLQNKGLFDDDFKSDNTLISDSVTKILTAVSSHAVSISESDAGSDIRSDNVLLEQHKKIKIKNILQDISSELLKQNAPVSDGLNHLLDAQIKLQGDKLKDIAKNAATAGFARGQALLTEQTEKELKAVQVDTHLKNVIDTIKNNPDGTLFPVTDTVKDTVIALINQNENQNFSDADKDILTESIQDKIGNHTEITRDDMINIITDFKGKLLKANAPVTAQARALVDANAKYAEKRLETIMQNSLFRVAGIDPNTIPQEGDTIKAVWDTVAQKAEERIGESLGLTPQEVEAARSEESSFLDAALKKVQDKGEEHLQQATDSARNKLVAELGFTPDQAGNKTLAELAKEQAQKVADEVRKKAIEETKREAMEALGLDEAARQQALNSNIPLTDLVKQKLTQSQPEIGQTIINGVMQALGNVVPNALHSVGSKVADAVGQRPFFDKNVAKIHNFAEHNPKMALAGKFGGGLAGVLLATKLFSMGLGTIFSPTPPPPPPPPKTVTDFLWNNSPWIAPMATPPAMSFIGSLWNNMFGRTNYQSDLSRLMEQMGQMGQNATPEPQTDSHQDAMNAMMAIFANGLGKINGGYPPPFNSLR